MWCEERFWNFRDTKEQCFLRKGWCHHGMCVQSDRKQDLIRLKYDKILRKHFCVLLCRKHPWSMTYGIEGWRTNKMTKGGPITNCCLGAIIYCWNVLILSSLAKHGDWLVNGLCFKLTRCYIAGWHVAIQQAGTLLYSRLARCYIAGWHVAI
jgi:hypothetical protein